MEKVLPIQWVVYANEIPQDEYALGYDIEIHGHGNDRLKVKNCHVKVPIKTLEVLVDLFHSCFVSPLEELDKVVSELVKLQSLKVVMPSYKKVFQRVCDHLADHHFEAVLDNSPFVLGGR